MPATFERLLARIKGEYIEMPGLRLSVEEASRLWDLQMDLTGTILRALVDDGFLKVSSDGKYQRPTDCPPDSHPRLERAPLKDETERNRREHDNGFHGRFHEGRAKRPIVGCVSLAKSANRMATAFANVPALNAILSSAASCSSTYTSCR